MVRHKLIFLIVEVRKGFVTIIEDIARIDIPKMILSHLHGYIINILLGVNPLEMLEQ